MARHRQTDAHAMVQVMACDMIVEWVHGYSPISSAIPLANNNGIDGNVKLPAAWTLPPWHMTPTTMTPSSVTNNRRNIIDDTTPCCLAYE
jgi:hypothetical protein